MAVPKMPIPGIGWLAYVKDTEGNLVGVMENDPSAAPTA
jgi:predicted enzyme related to lactoylglutathione lyase